jgi:DUF1680 family protein
VTQETEYPWEGAINIIIKLQKAEFFALRLRLPEWANSYKLALNGHVATPTLTDGWLTLLRHWHNNDQIEYNLPMEIARVTMSPQFIGYENRAALRRGPIVYCLEEQDVMHKTDALGDDLLSRLYIPEDATFAVERRARLVDDIDVVVLRGQIPLINWDDSETLVSVAFIPYGVWGNRLSGAMRIWLGARKAPSIEVRSIEPWPAQGSDD